MSNTIKFISIFILVLTGSLSLPARNPIIQTNFTADPAPMVYKDRVYLYTSHDEDSTINNFFSMKEWLCYSSADMLNWTDHGAVASLKNFSWINKTNGAWAPQCIERKGKFFLYVPIHGEGISVLTADAPTGPFKDILGKRLIEDSENVWHDIDPCVFIDKDGQAYLFWGNPSLYYVKLNEDMISYDRSIGKNGIVALEMTTEAFGGKKGSDDKIRASYTEGPWIYRRDTLYYLVYAAAGIPEYLAYSTAPTTEGPWTYRGFIMERAPKLAFTNHPGIIDFKGNSYLFYHDQDLSSGQGFKRSVSVEQFEYLADGSIPLITPGKEGVQQSPVNLNPYKRVEAETMAWSRGLKTAGNAQTGIYLSCIDKDDYLILRNVDFRKGPKKFKACLATAATGAKIELRLEHPEGELLGTLEVQNTGDWQNPTVQSCRVKKVKGVQDFCLVFKGEEGPLFHFDYWLFR